MSSVRQVAYCLLRCGPLRGVVSTPLLLYERRAEPFAFALYLSLIPSASLHFLKSAVADTRTAFAAAHRLLTVSAAAQAQRGTVA